MLGEKTHGQILILFWVLLQILINLIEMCLIFLQLVILCSENSTHLAKAFTSAKIFLNASSVSAGDFVIVMPFLWSREGPERTVEPLPGPLRLSAPPASPRAFLLVLISPWAPSPGFPPPVDRRPGRSLGRLPPLWYCWPRVLYPLQSHSLGSRPGPRVAEHEDVGGGAVGTAEAARRPAGLLRGLLRGGVQCLGAVQSQAHRLQQVQPCPEPPCLPPWGPKTTTKKHNQIGATQHAEDGVLCRDAAVKALNKWACVLIRPQGVQDFKADEWVPAHLAEMSCLLMKEEFQNPDSSDVISISDLSLKGGLK